MGKYYTSIICLEFAYNNRYADSKEEYIKLLKNQYLEEYNIQLSDSEITDIMEHENE